MIRSIAALAAVCALLSGCIASSSAEPSQSREERVRNHFADVAAAVGEKEALPSAPAIEFVLVAEDRLADGTVRSLWATTAGAGKSSCFYLDVETPKSGASGHGGCGAREEKKVTLNGNADSLVGDVGTWPATQARITAGGEQVTVAVKAQLFLVPVKLSGAASFDVTLLDDAQNVVTEVKGLRPAGR